MLNDRRVVLVDDHHLVRAGIRSLLEDTPGYEVVAEGADGSEALKLLEENKPDVLLMDIAMKNQSGIDVLPEIKKSFPELPVILLSMHATEDYLKQAFNAGAQAYLLKDSAEIELEMALDAVLKGEKYVSPKLSDKLLSAMQNKSGTSSGALESDVLTKRQKEILKMLALGLGTKEIAYQLKLSAKTVESHRAQIMERLHIRDIASLVRYAIKQGIVSLDD